MGNLTASSTTSQTISFFNSWIEGTTYSGTETSLVLNNTTFRFDSIVPSTLPSLILKNSEYKATTGSNTFDYIEVRNSEFKQRGGNVTTTTFIATDSTIRVGPDSAVNSNKITSYISLVDGCDLNSFKFVAATDGNFDVKLEFENNRCRGTYVGPEGVQGGVNYLFIRNNNFENTYSLTLYYPITHDNFSTATVGSIRGILIEGNTPSIDIINLTSDQTTNPNLSAAGTRVAQTKLDLKVIFNIPLGGVFNFGIPVSTSKQNFLWCPATLYNTGDGLDGSSGSRLFKTESNYGAFDIGDGNPRSWIQDYIAPSYTPSGQTAPYDCIVGWFKEGSNGGGNSERGQISIDFFKH